MDSNWFETALRDFPAWRVFLTQMGELERHYQSCPPQNPAEVTEWLISTHIKAVIKVARDISESNMVSMHELMLEGLLILFRCTQKYNGKDAKFSTYLIQALKKSLKRHASRLREVPQSTYNRARAMYSNPDIIFPDTVDLELIQLALQWLDNRVSLDSDDADLESVIGIFEDNQEDPVETLRVLFNSDQILEILTEEEYTILFQLFGFNVGPKDGIMAVAASLNLRVAQVKSLRSSALGKLRHYLEATISTNPIEN